MLKFSLIIPIILSSLYISFSRAQGTLSSCATNCSETIGSTAGCNPNQLNTPNCVCLNAGFFGSASACVWLECDAAEASSAEQFWLGVCSSYSQSSVSSVASSAPSGYVPPSSFVSSTSGGYGGHASSTPGVSSNAYSIATGTPIASSRGSSGPSSPIGASSPSTSSKPSPSTSSNLAATMPTHAAALIAGGIGAMVAVFV